MKNKLLLAITILAAFLRFYHITTNPPGLYTDEVSYGYNAYSILKTARDEYGTFLPATLRSFNDYKPPVYGYMLAPLIAIFGLNEFAIRFPSALSGTLTVPLVYLIAYKVFKHRKIALNAAFLLAISPWHLQFSRAAFEANVMLFFLVSGFTFFLYSNMRTKFLIASALAFGLAFDTYHGARIWLPLFLPLIIFFYRKEILAQKTKFVISTLIFAVFLIPFVSNFYESTTRARAVSILSQNNPVEIFTSNYLAHFSPVFLFFSGDSIGRHSVGGIGELYVFQIPFIVAGLIILLKKKQREARLLLAWLLLSSIPAALATPVPHALRAITAVPIWQIVTSLGIYAFAKGKINMKVKLIGLVVITIVTLHNFTTYLHLYHIHYPKEKGADWLAGTKEMVLYVNSIQKDYNQVLVTKKYGVPYVYFLFYTKYDPKKYLAEKGSTDHFGKYYFYNEYISSNNGRQLTVTDWGGHPRNIYKDIYINGNSLIYHIGE